MPAYFYHISLELLPSGPPHLHDSFHPSTADPTLILRAAREALRPFRKKRPKSAKEVSATRSSAAASLSRNNNNSESGGKQQQATTTITATTNSAARPCPQSSLSDSQTSTTYILPYPATLPEQISTDQRLDQISIECMDMVADPNRGDSQQQQQQQRQNPRKDTSSNSNNNNQITKGIGTSALGGLATKGKYVSLDQKLSESIWGIVHLYRDGEESPTLCDGDDDPSFLKGSAIARTSRISAPGTRNHFGSQNAFGTSSSSASAAVGASAYASSYSRANTAGAGFAGSASSASGGGDAPPPPEDCTTLCILAVPSYLSPADFVGLVGDETRDEVSHFRMIRTARANRYMVLMKFRSARKAREWQKEWNGKVFNSMEPETYHVVFVKNVEIQVAAPGSEGKFPDTNNDPFTAAPSTALAPSSLSSKPLAPPTPSLIELPTCPVCLERMDETTGLLTIICQHVFHCTCLQKWKGQGCPVCRYTQDDITKRTNNFFDPDAPSECSVCHAEANLWICLVCGSIGCGRYDGAHAFEHFKQTGHSFAMDIASQRVWDYVGDGYVHRIIQNKADGKLVELPAADNSALDPPDWADAVPREKWENMSLEYTHLLTSQLESQRTYFEEQVERAADKASQASAAATSAQEAAEKAAHQLHDLQSQYNTLIKETIPNLERDKGRAERRAEKFETMAHRMEKEWREEKAMNTSLVERVEFLDAEVQKLKLANEDLTEQNRDLTFFISGSEKLKDQGDDVVEGTVSVPEPEQSGRKKGKGRKR